ncbi:hypothetical protein HK098_005122 [Nowakowskiella sp. JEL0407]|nr:hypothetical protein HK098_005969 [Nowakowskiella sp. JEL0407]KAJ3119803.1 hypothetical protein HK098_005122 [Nowakowskiella sp. JEL0407]
MEGEAIPNPAHAAIGQMCMQLANRIREEDNVPPPWAANLVQQNLLIQQQMQQIQQQIQQIPQIQQEFQQHIQNLQLIPAINQTLQNIQQEVLAIKCVTLRAFNNGMEEGFNSPYLSVPFNDGTIPQAVGLPVIANTNDINALNGAQLNQYLRGYGFLNPPHPLSSRKNVLCTYLTGISRNFDN